VVISISTDEACAGHVSVSAEQALLMHFSVGHQLHLAPTHQLLLLLLLLSSQLEQHPHQPSLPHDQQLQSSTSRQMLRKRRQPHY
jgi:hypothetical protein